jgi:hypothetical protein
MFALTCTHIRALEYVSRDMEQECTCDSQATPLTTKHGNMTVVHILLCIHYSATKNRRRNTGR